jgi:hypothetical protein
MTTRRGFLAAMLAAGVAPSIVRAGRIMPVRVLEEPIVLPWAVNPLFRGTLGMYDGIVVHRSVLEAQTLLNRLRADMVRQIVLSSTRTWVRS